MAPGCLEPAVQPAAVPGDYERAGGALRQQAREPAAGDPSSCPVVLWPRTIDDDSSRVEIAPAFRLEPTNERASAYDDDDCSMQLGSDGIMAAALAAGPRLVGATGYRRRRDLRCCVGD